MVKKIFIVLLVSLITMSCSQSLPETDTAILDNSEVCIENLKNDTYTQACNDLEVEINKFVASEQKVIDKELLSNILDELTLITDISTNASIVEKTSDLLLSLINILKPITDDLNYTSYKIVKDDSDFKNLADLFIEKTSLTYNGTKIKRFDYTSKNYMFETQFIDDFDIVVTYYLNANKQLEKITINNNGVDKSIFYNFASLYSKYILSDQLKLNKNDANHDVSLIERQLQYASDEKYRSKNVLINTDDEVVSISIIKE